RDRLHRRYAYLGTDADPSSTRSLHRAGGRALARRKDLDRVPARLLPSRARPLKPVPGRVSWEASCRLQGWAPAVLLRSRPLGGEGCLFCLPCSTLADRLGGRLQATLCRARAGSALPEPLYAPRRYLRPSARRSHRRWCHLYLEGLQRRLAPQAHDPPPCRVHAPLSPSRSPRRLPAPT